MADIQRRTCETCRTSELTACCDVLASVFWPGMAADRRQFARDCEACRSLTNAQQKESIMPIETNRPWEKTGTDLFSWDMDYLLTIDYISS